jgi:hypothetical protein
MNNKYHTQTPHTTMERRINARIDAYLIALKNEIATKFEEVNAKHSVPLATSLPEDIHRDYASIMGFIYSADKLKLSKEDFMKRKRIKNVVPVFDRCHAKRANGEQCTRRKKDGCVCCGTHTKGTPHGMFDILEPAITSIKVDTWVQDIKGIMYHIDSMGNVYDPENIVANTVNPNIIAKYIKNSNGEYSIPNFG